MGANKSGEGRVGRGLTDHVYVDVDGTLLIWPGEKPGSPPADSLAAARAWLAGDAHDAALLPTVNTPLVEALLAWRAERRRHGADPVIVIWSMGGAEHAQLAYEMCFAKEYNVLCIAKPDLVIDDAGPNLWNKHQTVLPHNFP